MITLVFSGKGSGKYCDYCEAGREKDIINIHGSELDKISDS